MRRVIAALWIFSALAAAEPAREDPIADLDTVIPQYLTAFNIPGAAVGIIVDGKVVFSQGYGFRDTEKKLPVTDKTIFAIGSCTKAFTAFVLGQLVDEGKVALDDPVWKYIPEFRLFYPHATDHVTIRDLLAHRTGIARHDFLWYNSKLSGAEFLPRLPYLAPACDLREKFEYNNLMYVVAGVVIERVTGKPWADEVQARIFSPLAMNRSNVSVEKSQESDDFSLPYSGRDEPVHPIPFRNISNIGPAGAINSTLSDMLAWTSLQLSGSIPGKKMIGEETLQTMHAPQIAIPFKAEDVTYEFGYGLGWITGVYKNHYAVWHGGVIDGFIANVTLLPKKKIGVVILSNSSSYYWATIGMVNMMLDRLLGETRDDWIAEMQARDAEDHAPKKKEELLVGPERPARPLRDYVGQFENPGYGTVDVALEGDHLIARYNDSDAVLEHKCGDLFDGKVGDAQGSSQFTYAFSSPTSCLITELYIPFESALDPILFRRRNAP